ncbi:MAG: inosine/xanthosine triphosphatase [Lentisphaeraceae bacterium]|nr:inosine/xanthosine triphosphatase [Lentisphaeraceae bacterium]
MKYSVNVGSLNPVKVEAVKQVLTEYSKDLFDVSGVDVESDVNEQPQSFEETLQGAKNRAQSAFDDSSSFSIGLEDGIFAIPDEENLYMNICLCVIYNGEKFHYGTSSAFEYPREITDLVKGRGLDISEALGAAGYTNNADIGSAQGAIGLLSQGRLVRLDYTKQAINAVFIHLKNFVEL